MNVFVNIMWGWHSVLYVLANGVRPNNTQGISAARQAELDKCLTEVRSNGRNLEKLAAAAKKGHCGNCEEQTAVVMGFLGQHGKSPREQMVLWINNPALAHVFVVIGRRQGSQESDPTTWGPDAVIIDPWHQGGKVYAATEIETKMFRGNHNFQGKLEPVSVGRIN
jgi:hypothetical protein